MIQTRWSRLLPASAAIVLLGWLLHQRLMTLEALSWAALAVLGNLAVGELLTVRAGRQSLAPVSSMCLGVLALAPFLPGAHRLTTAGALTIGVAGLLIGCLLRRLAGLPLQPAAVLSRASGFVTVLVLGHVPMLAGRSLLEVLDAWAAPSTPAAGAEPDPVGQAGILLAVTLVGAAAEWFTLWALRRQTDVPPLSAIFGGENAELGGLVAAAPVLTAGAALASVTFGVWSLLILEWPLLLALFGIRRYSAVRLAVQQTNEVLSRVTEVSGHTRSGHAQLVAELCVRVARDLGLVGAKLEAVERAALLHDLGQIVLTAPLPGGATVEAAPSDQLFIARTGVTILRRAGGFEEVIPILEHQTAPYRLVREQDEEIPLESRILKAVNAYADLTGGAHSARAHDAAMERMALGLGYEYDPAVVDALARVAEQQPTND